MASSNEHFTASLEIAHKRSLSRLKKQSELRKLLKVAYMDSQMSFKITRLHELPIAVQERANHGHFPILFRLKKTRQYIIKAKVLSNVIALFTANFSFITLILMILGYSLNRR